MSGTPDSVSRSSSMDRSVDRARSHENQIQEMPQDRSRHEDRAPERSRVDDRSQERSRRDKSHDDRSRERSRDNRSRDKSVDRSKEKAPDMKSILADMSAKAAASMNDKLLLEKSAELMATPPLGMGGFGSNPEYYFPFYDPASMSMHPAAALFAGMDPTSLLLGAGAAAAGATQTSQTATTKSTSSKPRTAKGKTKNVPTDSHSTDSQSSSKSSSTSTSTGSKSRSNLIHMTPEQQQVPAASYFTRFSYIYLIYSFLKYVLL